MALDGVDDLAAIVRAAGYTVCAIIYIYRVWVPTSWRWANLGTALQYTVSIMVGMLVIVEPDAIPAFRLYVLTPLVMLAAIACIIDYRRNR